MSGFTQRTEDYFLDITFNQEMPEGPTTPQDMRDVVGSLFFKARVQGGHTFVTTKDELPAPVNDVITLVDNMTYFFTGDLDLEGCRLVGGQDTVLLGGSSENATLSSTGLSAAVALVTSEWSMPIRFMSFSHDLIFDLNGNGNAFQALDWFGVNFIGSVDIGTIANYGNALFTSCAWLSSAGMKFDGTLGTIAFDKCLIQSTGTETGVEILSTCTVERRFRTIYSAVVAEAGQTGITVSASATIPVQAYILDTVNFSGAGTATAGVGFADNKSLFVNNVGITNTAEVGFMTMLANATATTIGTIDTPVKAAGTTVNQAQTQRFSHTANRLTFAGAISRCFRVNAICTLSAGSNDEVTIYIALNGTIIPESAATVTSPAGGRSENVVAQVLTELDADDYIEVWVENNSGTANIIAENLSVLVEAIAQ